MKGPALHADIDGSVTCVGHNPPSRWAFYYLMFIMTERLMNNRDHLESLLAAVDALSHDAEIKSTESLERLLAAATRARQDVFPQG